MFKLLKVMSPSPTSLHPCNAELHIVIYHLNMALENGVVFCVS